MSISIKKREKIGLRVHEDPKAFIEYSINMQNVYKNNKEYNPDRERKVLIISDDIVADIIINKKHNLVVTGLFIRGRKLEISTVFITQSYFTLPQDVRLNCKHFLLWKFKTNESFSQPDLIIPQILTLKTL